MNKYYICEKCGSSIDSGSVNFGCPTCYENREKEYPEEFLSSDKKFKCTVESFGEYRQAREAASDEGVAYTMLDAEGIDILYWKGQHFVNTIGFCVVKKVEE